MGRPLISQRLRNLVLGAVTFFVLAAPTSYAQNCCIWRSWRDLCTPDRCETAPTTAIPPTTTPPTTIPPTEAPMPAPFTTAALSPELGSFSPGYLDNAVPMTHFRLRFDSAYRSNRPDRAEYFYAKCGCFPGGPGPILGERSVDYQDVSAYLEVAPRDWFSVFVEAPYRFLNPDNNANTAGLADINTGFKVVLIGNDRRLLTFQGRVFIPSGESDRGLGTDHVSLEPSLLYVDSLTDRLVVFGQFGDWIPVGGTDFAGNILRYGAGASYTIVDTGSFRVAPIVEVLGWTVLDGKEFAFPENVTFDASGDTIINAKIGARFGFGPAGDNRGVLGNSDFYIGYGRALTGDVWYKDIVRLEYRLRF